MQIPHTTGATGTREDPGQRRGEDVVMTEFEIPQPQRRICVTLRTHGRSAKLGSNVHKLSKGLRLAEILTKRGWRIENETKDYLYAEAPTTDFGDDPLIIEIDVPTQAQVLSLARQIHADAPDRVWAAQWGEWVARYYPRQKYSTQDADPFTGDRSEMKHGGWIDAHFEFGVHGLFASGVDDVGGADRYWEKVELVAPPSPTLFEKQDPVRSDDVATSSRLFEGSPTEVRLTRYERNPAARRACIDRWGLCCCVCGFDFETVYGQLGAGFIHVHHIVPLAEIGEQYEVDAVNDLRPVCPNCHAMLHRQETALTIEKLRSVVERKVAS